MAVKHFCDLCGKPAMDVAFTHLLYKRDVRHGPGFHLNCEFTRALETPPKHSDPRADICSDCMADGLRVIATQLELRHQAEE